MLRIFGRAIFGWTIFGWTTLSCAVLASIVMVGGIASAQDTNFATGPQYLMNFGSVLFDRPISTPTFSFPAPVIATGAADATASLQVGADDETVPPHPAPPIDLFPIYYGEAAAETIEISMPANSDVELPPSIAGNGVWQITTAEALRRSGLGSTLAEAAAQNRSHPHRTTTVYTNADLDRLRNRE
jgi:hypothetical protein